MYRLEISRTAHKQILRLPAGIRERIHSAISSLSENPRQSGNKKLTAREGYRMRVGDFRILYKVDDDLQKVTVFRVMSRGDVYKD